VLKFVPVIVKVVPIGPDVGEKEVTDGSAVNAIALRSTETLLLVVFETGQVRFAVAIDVTNGNISWR